MKKSLQVLILPIIIVITVIIGTVIVALSGEAVSRYGFSFSESGNAVTLSIDSNRGITAADISLYFDTAAANLLSYEKFENFNSDFFDVLYDKEIGRIRIVFMSSDGVIFDTGNIVTFYFEPITAEANGLFIYSGEETQIYDTDYSLGRAIIPEFATLLTPNPSFKEGVPYILDKENKIIKSVYENVSPTDLFLRLPAPLTIRPKTNTFAAATQ